MATSGPEPLTRADTDVESGSATSTWFSSGPGHGAGSAPTSTGVLRFARSSGPGTAG